MKENDFSSDFTSYDAESHDLNGLSNTIGKGRLFTLINK